jgi:Bacteriophage HK97-gp10, putative tail-component
MARTKIKVLLPGIRELKRDPGVAAFVAERAERVAAAARAGAPVESGTYRDSISVTSDVHPVSGAVSHIGAHVDYAMTVEANTGNLTRALDAAGGA